MAAKIRKAVIPVAGLGTRFLPATKSIPKEMLPIVDRPGILYIVEEAVGAGIEDIIFITGRHKTSLEEFFDHNYELEDILEQSGKKDLLKIARTISEFVNIVSIRQKRPLGLGHAILCAKNVVGDEPFAVLLGDEVMQNKPTVTAQLCEVYSKYEKSVCAIMEVPQEDVRKYGIAEIQNIKGQKKTFEVSGLIEKPTPGETKSRWALPGRYVFSPEIFKHLEKVTPSKNGEIQLTDGMVKLIKTSGLLGHSFDGQRYDTGDKAGFVKANIEFAMKHPEIGAEIKSFIIETAKKLE